MKRSLRLLCIVLISVVTLCVNAAEEDRTFRIINASHGLADNSAQAVICTKTGRMIISTLGNVNFYDGNSFSHIDTKQDYVYRLPAYTGNCHLYFDHSHHIWLKRTHTVTCIDLLTEQFVENVDSVFRAMGCQEPVLDVFTDAGGTLWTLTADGLLNVERQQTYTVKPDRNLQDIETVDGTLYLFYGDGSVVAMNLESGAVKHESRAYEEDQTADYDRTSVLCSAVDGFYQLRGGDRESILLFFNIRKQEWKTVMTQPYHLNNMAIHEGKLYIASAYGYWVYHPADGQTEHITSLSMDNGQTLDTDCNTLAFDRQGGMWIGTELRGLLYARPMASAFKVYRWSDSMAAKYAMQMEGIEQNITEFQGHRANCLFVDSRGWSWIGTNTGLFLYKTPKSDPIVFSKANGLYNNVVHSVVEGKRNNIWVATSCGISAIIIKDGEPVFVNSFGEEDNVPSESFVNCKAICTADSLIVMQAIDHVVVFRPTDLDSVNMSHPSKLSPKLTRILVNGHFVSPNVEVDGGVIVKRAVVRTKDIWLQSNHKSVSLTFSGLNYYRPRQTYYHVHLEGRGHDEWTEYSYFESQGRVDSKGMLHYSLVGLEPGDYELTVQASMFPNQWDDDETYKWSIHVSQPWWRTTGLYLLMGLLILVLVVYNLIYYARNMRMKTRRDHEEHGILMKIRSFVERNDAFGSQMLMPAQDDLRVRNSTATMQMTPEFMNLMTRLMPFVREHLDSGFSMHDLCETAQVDMTTLYELIMPEIHKNPRELVRRERLNKVEEMLRTTNKSIESIAAECGFYTPNYMIGNFFREYKMTPREYREQCAT